MKKRMTILLILFLTIPLYGFQEDVYEKKVSKITLSLELAAPDDIKDTIILTLDRMISAYDDVMPVKGKADYGLKVVVKENVSDAPFKRGYVAACVIVNFFGVLSEDHPVFQKLFLKISSNNIEELARKIVSQVNKDIFVPEREARLQM